ncbi:MAG: carboxypeptidase regulatory-like domain-containing protein, partial [Elusimicrobiota bacterium]
AKNFTNDTSRVSNTIAAYAQTSGGAPGDTAAPSAVNSLTAATGSSEGSVVLTWNSTGDDAGTGNLTGQYKIQYLTINSGWNDSSAQIVLSTTNITPGTVRVWDISSGLTAGVTYYFSVWSVDEAGNVSAVSNHPSAPAYKVYSGTQTTAGVYYGHEGLYSLGTGGNKVDTANERVSYRFTAQVTGNITSVYVPIFSVTGNPPAFYCGIQNDTSGNPAEAWLTGSAPGTFDATASGWQKVVLVSPANVTQGQVYHIVVEQVSTAPGTSNNIWLTSGLDYTKVLPLYNTLDANASSLRDSGTGTWAVLNGKQPVYLVEYDNGSVYGNPWNTNTDTDIYDVVTTGWEFTLDNVAADISITTLEAYIQKVYDDSGDDLYYEIRDITSGSTVVKSGTFATEASFVLSSSYTWKSMDISPALTLTKGKKYRITFSSPYSYGGYRLHIPRTTGNGISYVNTTYNSGSSYSVTDTGSGNVADTNADPAIRMTAAGVQFADTTPPGKVVNLIAQPGVNTGELILQWSTPGDDDAAGNLTGSYNIEYLTVNTGWSRAGSQIITSVSNVIPGTAVNLTLTGLVSGATYYFRMWYADEETNWSESSNIVLSYAKPAVVADTTPPAGINTLVAMSNQTQLQVSLNWQSTGDDGSIGNISGFYSLQYLTTDGPWDVESAQVVIATSSIVPGSQQSYTLAQALAEGVTYYFSLWTTDDALNVSPQSNIAVVYVSPQTVADTIAPGAITNLTAVSGNVSGQVILSWTSPGNDGYVNLLNGNVLIQYATVDSGWDAQAAQVVVPMSNINPGSTQSYSVISPLIPGTTYYFSAWVRDAANNISAVSNHPSAVAQKMPGSVSGIIRQAVTLTPVAGAVIEILQDNAVITQTSSNQNGVYILQLTTGTYNLRVSAERYQTSIASDIVVGLESSVQVNIDLTLLSNTAPSLSWTNETGYTTAGVAPLTGRPGANFIFRVKYRDTEDDPPLSSYPKVHIKKSGVEVIVATLTAVGNNYSQGAVYAATVTFTSGGSYTYWFEAYDIYYATASGVPTNEMSGLQVLNRSPVLSWTGETGYFNTGEKPVTGTVEDLITYRVKYVDYDGDTPLTGYPRVVIKLEGNDFVTIPLNVSTGPYTTGVICSTSVVLSFAGRYTYKFEAYDKYNAKASGLPVSNNDGPTISGYNLTPEVFLQWTDETGYKDTAVKPSFGT